VCVCTYVAHKHCSFSLSLARARSLSLSLALFLRALSLQPPVLTRIPSHSHPLFLLAFLLSLYRFFLLPSLSCASAKSGDDGEANTTGRRAMLLATCGSVAIALSTATHAKAATLAPAAPQMSEGKAVGLSDEVPVLSSFCIHTS